VSASDGEGEDVLGPVQYVLVEFPGSRFNGSIAPALADLVDRGLVRILELMVVRKDDDGTVSAFDLLDLDPDEIGDLGALAAGTLGLILEEDVLAAAEALEPGTTAGLLVWEDLWAIPLAKAIRGSGGELVAGGRIPVQDLIEALEAAEAAETA
jgi:hypothetical protein